MGPVTTRRAARDIGYDCPDEKTAGEVLRKAVLPVKDEDARVAALRLELPVLIKDWQDIAFEVSLRDALRPRGK